MIRLNVPPLSGDVRRKMVARMKELTEEAKVAVRNVRRDGNKQADQEEKDKDPDRGRVQGNARKKSKSSPKNSRTRRTS